MKPITLSKESENGTVLEATFLPHIGMNLISYKLNDLEVIDQSTRNTFARARNGLGALIGPHFHERANFLIPKIDHVFTHEKYMRERNKIDLFSHGVARYAPWDADLYENTIHAELTGKNQLEGVPLAEIEGQNFKMEFDASLTDQGLTLTLSVVSETDSVVGFHYYYALTGENNCICAPVQKFYLSNKEKKTIPSTWNYNSQHNLIYPLNRETDHTFFPYPDPLNGKVVLKTDTHRLNIETHAPSAENCWQLWHPKGASFVCIEPISAQNPRKPNLTVSSVSCTLSIEQDFTSTLQN